MEILHKVQSSKMSLYYGIILKKPLKLVFQTFLPKVMLRKTHQTFRTFAVLLVKQTSNNKNRIQTRNVTPLNVFLSIK